MYSPSSLPAPQVYRAPQLAALCSHAAPDSTSFITEGHYNHCLFWNTLCNHESSGSPSPKVRYDGGWDHMTDSIRALSLSVATKDHKDQEKELRRAVCSVPVPTRVLVGRKEARFPRKLFFVSGAQQFACFTPLPPPLTLLHVIITRYVLVYPSFVHLSAAKSVEKHCCVSRKNIYLAGEGDRRGVRVDGRDEGPVRHHRRWRLRLGMGLARLHPRRKAGHHRNP